MSSPQLVADLAVHGVVRRKTYVMRASEEAAAQPAFWLGVLDGDGTVRISRTGVPTIGLVGTEALMTQFAEFLERKVLSSPPTVCRKVGGQDVLWEVKVSGDSSRHLAEVWLPILPVSMEHKRAKLAVAVAYESRATKARLGIRRRRCDFCGAWVERMPSQLGTRVFCNRSHFGRWNAQRRDS